MARIVLFISVSMRPRWLPSMVISIAVASALTRFIPVPISPWSRRFSFRPGRISHSWACPVPLFLISFSIFCTYGRYWTKYLYVLKFKRLTFLANWPRWLCTWGKVRNVVKTLEDIFHLSSSPQWTRQLFSWRLHELQSVERLHSKELHVGHWNPCLCCANLGVVEAYHGHTCLLTARSLDAQGDKKLRRTHMAEPFISVFISFLVSVSIPISFTQRLMLEVAHLRRL